MNRQLQHYTTPGIPGTNCRIFLYPAFECRHNMNYWERGEYLGLGPGASSFVAGRRFTTISNHAEYARRLANGQPVMEGSEFLTMEQSAHERLLLGLRTARGVDLRRFRQEFGDSCFSRLEATLGPLSDTGLLKCSRRVCEAD